MGKPNLRFFAAAGFVGGDWTFHLTQPQLNRLLENSLSAWSELGIMLGGRQSFLTSFPIHVFLKLLSLLGITAYSQSLVLLFFILAPCCMYLLLRHLRLSRFPSILGSLLYVLTPVVFNYLLMGWIFVLFAYALFPLITLFFLKSVQGKNLTYAVVAGLLFSLALMQSQALVWIPLILIAFSIYLVRNQETFFAFLKAFAVVILLFLLLHSHWWPSLLLVKDPGISGGELVLSSISVGTSARLSFDNLIRLWGSLYNYQFETAYPNSLAIISFLPPIIMILTLLFGIKKRLTWSLTFLALIPMLLFITPREVISHFPYSNLIRDTARFTVLSTFAYVVLITIFMNWLYERFLNKQKRLLAMLLILLLALYTKPFWDESFFGKGKSGFDFRYRSYTYPNSFKEVEKILLKEKQLARALYLPLGGTYGLLDDERFSGSYQGIRDIFAGYSPIPGVIWFSDRRFPVGGDLVASLEEAVSEGDEKLVRGLSNLIGTKYLVFRQNTWPEAHVLKDLEEKIKSSNTTNVYEAPEISLYQLNNYVPYIYSPSEIIAIGNNYGNLADAVTYEKLEEENSPPAFVSLSDISKAETIILSPKRVSTFMNEPISWNQGWLWPQNPRIAPSSPKYPLMRIKELLIEKTTSDPLKKADVLIWHASKRIMEENKWGKQRVPFFKTDTEEYLRKLENTFAIFKSLTFESAEGTKLKENVKKDDYLGILMKVLAFSQKAEEKTPTQEAKEEIVTKNNEFRKWLDQEFYGWCPLEDYCYEVDIPLQGDYDLLSPNHDLENNLKGFQLNLLEGKKNETPLPKLENSDFEQLAVINYEKGQTQRFILNLEPPPNLAEDTQIKVEAKKLAETKTETLTDLPEKDLKQPTNTYYVESLKKIPVKGLAPGRKYELSFEYKTVDGPLRLTLFEKQFNFDKVVNWGADYSKVRDKEVFTRNIKVLDRTIHSSYNNFEEYQETDGWEQFEIVFTADQGSKGAELYFQPMPSEETISTVEIRNLGVREILKPKLILVKTQSQATTRKPLIDFQKLKPTRYQVSLRGIQDPFLLVFNESFHEGWQLYKKEVNPIKAFLSKPLTTKHSLVNGFANGYFIEPTAFGASQDYDLIIEFWPQRLTFLGLFVSGATLIISLLYLARKIFNIR